MTFAEEMYFKALDDPAFSDMKPVLEKCAGELPFPLEKPYVSFGTEYENGSCLLGSGMVVSEIMTVNVAVDEEINEGYCRECAKAVTLAVMSLDTGKRIISVSAGGCEYNDAVGCYSIKLKFGLREVLRDGGD